MYTFANSECWVFDLDNTLYSAASSVFAEIDSRMTDYVARYLGIDPLAATTIQKQYYAQHGTTLKGLMTEHAMDPAEFLDHVHDVDLSPVAPCQMLQVAIGRLPGRKFVYTNGSRRHAERVTKHLGIDHLFDGMTGIDDLSFDPKPDPRAYDRFCERHGIAPARSVFFEDLARNLEPAHAMGFTTVLVQTSGDWSHEPEEARPGALPDMSASPWGEDGRPPHVHYVTDDLAGFLTQAVPAEPKDTAHD
ncbi:MAG: pyrimidine 5'-nucleotidase [Pseudomonadota bacterium]